MSDKIIDSSTWDVCSICGMSVSKMTKPNKKSCYKSEKFKKHLKDIHNLSINEYFVKIEEKTDLCKCGCGKTIPVTIRGKNFVKSDYLRWHSDPNNVEFKKFVEKIKIERKGKGNPMYGKTPWNSGLTKENNEILKKLSLMNIGKKVSEKTREKQSIAYKKHKPAHTGHFHSEETKNILRKFTLERIKNNGFTQTMTKPHKTICSFLDILKVEYETEKIVGWFSYDIWIKSLNLFIEIDGDYFHSNPIKYPNGPKTKTQKINFHRDYKKNQKAKELELDVIHIWEFDINNYPHKVFENLKELINEE